MTATRIRVIDLETTGFPTDWRVQGGEGYLCDPCRPIPPETSAIHHIIDADVEGLMIWPEMLDCLVGEHNVGPGSLYAAHNANFERQWITDDITNGAGWICTYKCALRLWPEAPSHSNQALRYWRRPQGLNRQAAHVAYRAYPDAYVSAFLLRDMLELTTPEQLVAWTKQPALLARIPFGQFKGQPWSAADEGLLEWMLHKTFGAPDFTENIHFTARRELSRRADEGQTGATP